MNKVKKILRAVDEFQQQHAWLAFPVAVWKKFGDDQAGNLAMLVAWFAFVSIFRLGTASEIRWRQLRLAAVISGVIWQVLQAVGGYFISHQLAHASPVYGTFAVVIGLIAWLHLQAELTLYAVEINVVKERRLWPRSIAPPPYTEQDRRAYQLYAQAQKRVEDEEVVVGVGGEDDRKKTSG
jgi:uncharacterized BrkB/YihY/UPF0761 family membrane protein